MESISAFLKKKGVLFSEQKIATIVELIFDWVQQVPGAFLDEGQPAIPHSFEEEEALRQLLNEIEAEERRKKKQFLVLPIPNFNDAWTDIVYVSDKLKDFHPALYRRLTALLDEMEIEWDELIGTKDIWLRDYMPIQIAEEIFLFYDYDPDYLKDKGETYRTDSHPRGE